MPLYGDRRSAATRSGWVRPGDEDSSYGVGVIGADVSTRLVVWPNRPYASYRAEWLLSADAAGCFDTLISRDRGDCVPLGANVTADAFVDLFAQFGIEPHGTTLLQEPDTQADR